MSHHREPVTALGAPAAVGPYSHAVRAGGLLFCSGQVPLDPESGELVDGGPGEQARRCLENLTAVCAAAGASLADAVRLHRLPDRHGRVRGGQRGLRDATSRPTRRRASRSAVAGLPKGALVEIDAVVALPD